MVTTIALVTPTARVGAGASVTLKASVTAPDTETVTLTALPKGKATGKDR
jgi:hypothetical protein